MDPPMKEAATIYPLTCVFIRCYSALWPSGSVEFTPIDIDPRRRMRQWTRLRLNRSRAVVLIEVGWLANPSQRPVLLAGP